MRAEERTDVPIELRSVSDRLYRNLRLRAQMMLREQRSHIRTTATSIANEVYCRLSKPTMDRSWENNRYFFADAIRAIRNILIERARARGTLKRGKGWRRMESLNIDQIPDAKGGLGTQRGQFEGPLQKLEVDRPDLMALVDLKVIRGLNFSEIAQLQGRSKRTIERQWYLVRRQLAEYLLQDGYSVNRPPGRPLSLKNCRKSASPHDSWNSEKTLAVSARASRRI